MRLVLEQRLPVPAMAWLEPPTASAVARLQWELGLPLVWLAPAPELSRGPLRFPRGPVEG